MKDFPPKQKVWHTWYRNEPIIFLLLALIFIGGIGFCEESVTRLEFCERLTVSCFYRAISEVEIIQSGIIDPHPDGKFHLDWPISRADVARICLRILEKISDARPLPGFFADVKLSSPFYSVLAKIGGIFPPLAGDRFGPDVLVTPKDSELVIKRFKKQLPTGKIPSVFFSRPNGEAPQIFGKTFPIEFQPRGNKNLPKSEEDACLLKNSGEIEKPWRAQSARPRGMSHANFLPWMALCREAQDGRERPLRVAKGGACPPLSRSEEDAENFLEKNSPMLPEDENQIERLSRLSKFVPHAQLSPQSAFNLREAEIGVEEIEKHLESMELSILDLVYSQVENNSEKIELKEGLKQFHGIIEPLLDKLRFSSEELQAALLTDSESLALAGKLRNRIRENGRRLLRMQEIISEKLKTL